MKIALGCDHGGYAMKEDIKKQLEGLGHEVKDCGTYSTESCDYPIFGEAAARAVASGECEYGIDGHRHLHCGEQGQGHPLRALRRYARGAALPPAQQREHDGHRCGLHRPEAGRGHG